MGITSTSKPKLDLQEREKIEEKLLSERRRERDPFFQYNRGMAYYNGDGVAKDYEEAVKWFRKAAIQGNAPAQNSLGRCYESGQGVAQNDAEAVKWFIKAAQQGDADALYRLGECYENGRGVAMSSYQAIRFYKRAAAQGVAIAKTALKRME